MAQQLPSDFILKLFLEGESMSGSCTLELYFANEFAPGLYKTIFTPPAGGTPVIGIRGTTISPGGVPFIWGTATQSLMILFLTAASRRFLGNPIIGPHLEGDKTTPVGALARLLKKRPNSWLYDLFSSDASGRSLLERMVVMENARSQRPGPITATLRADYLSPKNIKVFLDGKDISDDNALIHLLLNHLKISYIPRNDPLANKRQLKKPAAHLLVPADPQLLIMEKTK